MLIYALCMSMQRKQLQTMITDLLSLFISAVTKGIYSFYLLYI